MKVLAKDRPNRINRFYPFFEQAEIYTNMDIISDPRIVEHCKNSGLEVLSVHAPKEISNFENWRKKDYKKTLSKSISLAKRLGSEFVVVHLPERYEDCARTFSDCLLQTFVQTPLEDLQISLEFLTEEEKRLRNGVMWRRHSGFETFEEVLENCARFSDNLSATFDIEHVLISLEWRNQKEVIQRHGDVPTSRLLKEEDGALICSDYVVDEAERIYKKYKISLVHADGFSRFAQGKDEMYVMGQEMDKSVLSRIRLDLDYFHEGERKTSKGFRSHDKLWGCFGVKRVFERIKPKVPVTLELGYNQGVEDWLDSKGKCQGLVRE